MSYIGENVAVADFSKQTFTANSSDQVFTLSSSVANSSCLIVSVGGVIQEPDVAYTASGTVLTFSVAPTTGNDVYVIYMGKELPQTTHGDNTITNALIPDGSITNDKINSLVGTKLTGALPAIDGSALTGLSADTGYLEDNIAMLGFKLAANNSLAKYNLVDRIIDEYQDGTGIDASASIGEETGGTGTGKYYRGSTIATPNATGGTITTDGSDTIHTFTSDGTFTTDIPQDADFLVVAGGGSGGAPDYSGGGGAGGLRTSYGSTSGGGANAETDASFSATTYAIVVGDGGVAGLGSYTNGGATHNGQDSSIIGTGVSITSDGGGRSNYNVQGTPGGSGGADGREGGVRSRIAAAGTVGQGYAGGTSDPSDGGAGGGGAGAIGENAPTNNSRAGNGGAGLAVAISGSSVTYAGGGGGSAHQGAHGTGGAGGGGAGTTSTGGNGTVNTGGGGGGRKQGGAGVGAAPLATGGGSGIVIIRRPTQASIAADVTLQSTANTASTAPTKGDITMLIEDTTGTAVLNTDIKAYVSRDGGSGWDQGTLTQEGTWGTNRKVISFHDTTFSNSASGTDMRYKITTHNQSGSKETRIHATSLAWS